MLGGQHPSIAHNVRRSTQGNRPGGAESPGSPSGSVVYADSLVNIKSKASHYKNLLLMGEKFKKSSATIGVGKRERLFWVSQDLSKLYWSKKKTDDDPTFRLTANLNSVTAKKGKKSDAPASTSTGGTGNASSSKTPGNNCSFNRREEDNACDDRGMVMTFIDREVVVECPSEQCRDDWIAALTWLREKNSSVSGPYNVQRTVHVNTNMEWEFPADEAMDTMITLKEMIGQGTFGKVFVGVHTASNLSMAVKLVFVDGTATAEEMKTEVDVLKTCRSKHIIDYFGCWGPDYKGQLWIMMEYCKFGSIVDVMQKTNLVLSEAQVAYVCAAALQGLIYLHKKDIIHRDIKGHNILLSRTGDVKLTDFGVSKQVKRSQKKGTMNECTIAGSPHWMAPEVAAEMPQSFKADIWSLGITAIELATGLPPRYDRSGFAVMNDTMQLPPPSLPEPEDGKEWTKTFSDFVRKCLVKDPRARPSADIMMQHPFVANALDEKKVMIPLIAAALRKDIENASPGKQVLDAQGGVVKHPGQKRAHEETKENAPGSQGVQGMQGMQGDSVGKVHSAEAEKKKGKKRVEETKRTLHQGLMKSSEDVQVAFSALDSDGDGFITTTALHEFVRTLVDNLSAEEIDKLVHTVSASGEGKVAYKDFFQLMHPKDAGVAFPEAMRSVSAGKGGEAAFAITVQSPKVGAPAAAEGGGGEEEKATSSADGGPRKMMMTVKGNTIALKVHDEKLLAAVVQDLELEEAQEEYMEQQRRRTSAFNELRVEFTAKVGPPQTRGVLLGKYNCYPIEVQYRKRTRAEERSSSASKNVSTFPDIRGESITVWRRYSQFVWIRNQLAKECPWSIIPPIPNKSLANTFSPEVVGRRQVALQFFLLHLSRHPLLSQSPSLRAFLSVNEDVLNTLMKMGDFSAFDIDAAPDAQPAVARSSSRAGSEVETDPSLREIVYEGAVPTIATLKHLIKREIGSQEIPRIASQEECDLTVDYAANYSAVLKNWYKATLRLLEAKAEEAKTCHQFSQLDQDTLTSTALIRANWRQQSLSIRNPTPTKAPTPSAHVPSHQDEARDHTINNEEKLRRLFTSAQFPDSHDIATRYNTVFGAELSIVLGGMKKLSPIFSDCRLHTTALLDHVEFYSRMSTSLKELMQRKEPYYLRYEMAARELDEITSKLQKKRQSLGSVLPSARLTGSFSSARSNNDLEKSASNVSDLDQSFEVVHVKSGSVSTAGPFEVVNIKSTSNAASSPVFPIEATPTVLAEPDAHVVPASPVFGSSTTSASNVSEEDVPKRRANRSISIDEAGAIAKLRDYEIRHEESTKNLDVSKAKLEFANEKFLSETALFMVNKHNDVRKLMIDFVKRQIQQEAECARAWEDVNILLKTLPPDDEDNNIFQVDYS